MDPKRLFRAAALEKLSSPERLDVMMQVTSPAAWLALTALGAVLVIVIAWSIIGTMSIKVSGRGILLSGGTVNQITAGATGKISEILVAEGDMIQEGTVILRVDQPDLLQQVQNSRQKLNDILWDIEQNDSRDSALIRDLEVQRGAQEQAVADVEGLQREGLATASQVQQERQTLSNIQSQITSTRDRITGRHNNRRETQRELAALETQLGNQGEIQSPYAGRVIEVFVSRGSQLAPGTPVLNVEPVEDVQAVLFVPASEGKKVKPGMRAQISPSHVRVEEWGFMLGEVQSVSEFPVGRPRLKHVLQNEKLAEDLAGRSAPYEVKVELIKDETTVSGFQWSSSKGPPVDVVSGTTCGGNITVQKKRPISYVLPIFRRTLGIG